MYQGEGHCQIENVLSVEEEKQPRGEHTEWTCVLIDGADGRSSSDAGIPTRQIVPEQLMAGITETLDSFAALKRLYLINLDALTMDHFVFVVSALPSLKVLRVERCLLLHPVLLLQDVNLDWIWGSRRNEARVLEFEYVPYLTIEGTNVDWREVALGILVFAVQRLHERPLGSMLDKGHIFRSTLMDTLGYSSNIRQPISSENRQKLEAAFDTFRNDYTKPKATFKALSRDEDEDSHARDAEPERVAFQDAIRSFLEVVVITSGMSPMGARVKAKYCTACSSYQSGDLWSEEGWESKHGECKLEALSGALRTYNTQSGNVMFLNYLFRQMTEGAWFDQLKEWKKKLEDRGFRRVFEMFVNMDYFDTRAVEDEFHNVFMSGRGRHHADIHDYKNLDADTTITISRELARKLQRKPAQTTTSRAEASSATAGISSDALQDLNIMFVWYQIDETNNRTMVLFDIIKNDQEFTLETGEPEITYIIICGTSEEAHQVFYAIQDEGTWPRTSVGLVDGSIKSTESNWTVRRFKTGIDGCRFLCVTKDFAIGAMHFQKPPVGILYSLDNVFGNETIDAWLKAVARVGRAGHPSEFHTLIDLGQKKDRDLMQSVVTYFGEQRSEDGEQKLRPGNIQEWMIKEVGDIRGS